MLTRAKPDRGAVETAATESRVPRDHLLRKIDAAVDREAKKLLSSLS